MQIPKTVEGKKGLEKKQDRLRRLLSFAGMADEALCFSGGLALAQVLFFYVKYLVLFGVPALLMRLDGLTPPPLPRCVSTMFSFTGMWRSVSWFKSLGCVWWAWLASESLAPVSPFPGHIRYHTVFILLR